MNNIRIGILEAKVALSDENRWVAFCFALKIKFMFRSSDLHFGSTNQAAKALGYNKRDFKKYLDLAIKFGYCRIHTDQFGTKKIISNKIHDSKHYSYKTRRGEITKLSLPNLKSLIRKIVVMNTLNIISETCNTHSRAINGHTMKDVRSARRMEARMLQKPFNDKYIGCSYLNMMKKMNGTWYQAKKAITEITKSGMADKVLRITVIDVDGHACTYNHSYRDANNKLIIISAKNRNAQLRCSNRYKVIDSQISIAKSGTNQRIVKARKAKWVKDNTQ